MSPIDPSSSATELGDDLLDDDLLADAVTVAAVAPLLATVAHLTGDMTLLRPELAPDPDNILDPEGGLTPERQAEGRQLALDALRRWRDDGARDPGPLEEPARRELFAFLVGEHNVEGYHDLLHEELALHGEDRRAPDWHLDDVLAASTGSDRRSLTVGIVGAGMSGVLCAHRLGQAGVPYVVFEKNDDVGGTWLENTYPGCRVDVPNSLYSYSFAQRAWPQNFSSQDHLLEYFRTCADDLGVRANIRFGTEVAGAEWDEDEAHWIVHTRDREGVEHTESFDVLVSAVGQLNRPSFPDIAGIDDFAGEAFHSARWRHDLDLTGKRVAVIGTGASAVQFIPPVADLAAQLHVFQRTPNWLVPTADYHEDVPASLQTLAARVPAYANWYRLWLFWRTHEGLLSAAKVDPGWSDQHRSVSALNDIVREILTDYLRTTFAGHPELLEHVIPDYPPIAKRVLRDNGSWGATLGREHVHLHTGPIERIVPEGIVTAEGTTHEVDVIIYGTGFSASAFLTPMRITGRDGADLHETWGGDARAHLGLTVPGFPNLFCLYGPNTNIVINGSIIYFSELEVRYLLGCLRQLAEGPHRSLDCRSEVHDAFNDRVDAANREMAWGAADVSSWYRNAFGRVAQNWPFSLLEYWEATHEPDPDDYEWR